MDACIVVEPAAAISTVREPCAVRTSAGRRIAKNPGTLSCQGTYEYRCNNGVWERIEGSAC